MLIAIAAAGWLLAQAAAGPPPAQAAAPAAQPTAAAKPEKPKKPKLICEDETSTDSFIAKRVCRTPEQVEAERQAGRSQTDAVQDRQRYCTGPSC